MPYAGASAAIYMKWKRALAPGIECVPLELAGRGIRSGEPFYAGMKEAADDALEKLLAQIDSRSPYAVFGHSMGAMILFEVCLLLRDGKFPPPAALFFSGRPAPDLPRAAVPIHKLPDREFAERILEMGATSPEVFAHRGLMNVFVPILRADFRLVETYRYEEKGLLPWELTILAGSEEQWSDEELEGWRRRTSAGCRIVRPPGGHFYWQNGPDPDWLPGFLEQALRKAYGEKRNFA
nr:alpha/beta fold hydrolase [Cohnella sp. CFH 77786]